MFQRERDVKKLILILISFCFIFAGNDVFGSKKNRRKKKKKHKQKSWQKEARNQKEQMARIAFYCNSPTDNYQEPNTAFDHFEEEKDEIETEDNDKTKKKSKEEDQTD